MRKQLTLGAMALALAGQTLAADCDHERPLGLELNARDATSLRLDAGAGWLRVRGVEGIDTVRIEGRACASDADALEHMRLIDDSAGNRLLVETDIPELSGWFGNNYAFIHLEVEVPAALALEIHDGSGEMELTGIGPARIHDGSGEIRVRDALGDLQIEDGSGGISVSGASGDVLVLEDGSGEIQIDGVQGSVTIEEDGSGSIVIANVGHDVRIGDDGSGSIEIREVVGNVRIDDDRSGSIEVADVGGDLEVGPDGSGGVRYARIDGRIDIHDDRHRLK